MRTTLRTLILALAISPASILAAQAAADPSGHWEGSISIPSGEAFRIEFDLARASNGKLSGTFSNPQQRVKGLPLSAVTMQDSVVTIELKANGGGTFQADLSADGAAMSGVFTSTQFGPMPFTLTRKGDARLDGPPISPAIGRELEGTWTGRLDVEAGFRLVLKMANQTDGNASGVMTSVDEGGLEVPVAIKQDGTKVVLTLPVIGSSFSGGLNPSGTELVGVYSTSTGLELPLTLAKTGSVR